MFEVGQAVFSATHGKGVVTEINKTTLYPVTVKFDPMLQSLLSLK